MLAFALLLAAQQTPAPTAAPARPRVVLLELEARGVDAGVARTLDDGLSVAFARAGVFDVVTPADLRAMLDLEASKRELGCKNDNACISEIASALGAEAVVHGAVARVDDQLVLTVSLFDARENRATGREQVTGETARALLPRLQSVAHALTAAWQGADPNAAAQGPKLGAILAGTGMGIGVVGAGVGVTLLLLAQGTLDDARSSGADKESAGTLYTAGSAVAFGGGTLALVSAGLFAFAWWAE